MPTFLRKPEIILLMYHVLQTKTAATPDGIKHIGWKRSPAVHYYKIYVSNSLKIIIILIIIIIIITIIIPLIISQ